MMISNSVYSLPLSHTATTDKTQIVQMRPRFGSGGDSASFAEEPIVYPAKYFLRLYETVKRLQEDAKQALAKAEQELADATTAGDVDRIEKAQKWVDTYRAIIADQETALNEARNSGAVAGALLEEGPKHSQAN